MPTVPSGAPGLKSELGSLLGGGAVAPAQALFGPRRLQSAPPPMRQSAAADAQGVGDRIVWCMIAMCWARSDRRSVVAGVMTLGLGGRVCAVPLAAVRRRRRGVQLLGSLGTFNTA